MVTSFSILLKLLVLSWFIGFLGVILHDIFYHNDCVPYSKFSPCQYNITLEQYNCSVFSHCEKQRESVHISCDKIISGPCVRETINPNNGNVERELCVKFYGNYCEHYFIQFQKPFQDQSFYMDYWPILDRCGSYKNKFYMINPNSPLSLTCSGLRSVFSAWTTICISISILILFVYFFINVGW